MKSLGADKVIDYTKEDFAKSGDTYDVIFDAVGKSSFSSSIRSLKKKGLFLMASPGLSHMVRGLWTSMTSSKKVVYGAVGWKTEDLVSPKELVEAGKLKSVIDRRYPLEQIAEAHRYVDKGQKIGNVIITVPKIRIIINRSCPRTCSPFPDYLGISVVSICDHIVYWREPPMLLRYITHS